MAADNGLEKLTEHIEHCLRACLRDGFGKFTVRLTRVKRGKLRAEVDGGIYNKVVYVCDEETEAP